MIQHEEGGQFNVVFLSMEVHKPEQGSAGDPCPSTLIAHMLQTLRAEIAMQNWPAMLKHHSKVTRFTLLADIFAVEKTFLYTEKKEFSNLTSILSIQVVEPSPGQPRMFARSAGHTGL